MGLFDFMNTGDPEKDSMIREGLLQFGLGLMSSRGRTLPAIGNAGRQSLSAMDAYKQRQFQGKLNDYQLKQLKQAVIWLSDIGRPPAGLARNIGSGRIRGNGEGIGS